MELFRKHTIERIRIICQKVNPDIDTRPVTLVDMLRVVVAFTRAEDFPELLIARKEKYAEICALWDFEHDDLTKQSNEVLKELTLLV